MFGFFGWFSYVFVVFFVHFVFRLSLFLVSSPRFRSGVASLELRAGLVSLPGHVRLLGLGDCGGVHAVHSLSDRVEFVLQGPTTGEFSAFLGNQVELGLRRVVEGEMNVLVSDFFSLSCFLASSLPDRGNLASSHPFLNPRAVSLC